MFSDYKFLIIPAFSWLTVQLFKLLSDAVVHKKINFRRFQYAYSLLNSFIITSTYLAVIYLIKTMIMKVIIGIVLLILYCIVNINFIYCKDISLPNDSLQGLSLLCVLHKPYLHMRFV